jgi:tRNA pseudouridine32 synthase/23S rRNA pseudouridine746 synthase
MRFGMAQPALWAERILFIDGEAIVLDKPAGLAVHPGPATPRSLEDHLPDLRFGFQRAPSPVHRLDRDTSGCLLLARNPKALKRFAAEFEAGRVTKTYLAVLEGVLREQEGAIDLPLAKVSSRAEGWRMVPSPSGKPSLTRWRLVGEAQGRALVRFEPATGRTHQLRVHAAQGLGVPILGDPIYGRGNGEGTMLHAAALRLERGAKPPVEARAPLPPTFAALGFADAGL